MSYAATHRRSLQDPMKKIADGRPWSVPATIDGTGALEEITAALERIGYAGKQG